MTPDERSLLSRFLDDLAAARDVRKDSEADGMIRQAIDTNPDAAYLLVQHAIVADQSLHAAQARIAELEAQLCTAQSAQPAPSFLPQNSRPDPWHREGQPTYQPAYSPMPQDYAPMPPQERPGLFSSNSGLGSFLRNAGTTAAGVAGGEMLFNGLSDLFGHHGGGGGFLGGGQGFADRPEQVTINNYGDDFDRGDLDEGNSW